MGICYIIGAAKFSKMNIEPKKDDYIMAADGGFDVLLDYGIIPDEVIGDFDSSHLNIQDIKAAGVTISKFPVKKDYTDMELAVRRAVELSYRKIIIYGGLGGELSHTLANIQLGARFSGMGIDITIIGEDEEVSFLTNSTVEFEAENTGKISVISHTDNSYGVSIEGLMYEVNNITLKNSFALGVSNEFVGKKSRISVQEGTLILIKHFKAT